MVLIPRRSSRCSATCWRKISVPLRGLWFLSDFIFIFFHPGSCEFPSPCGDYGSYQLHDYGNCSKDFHFRPLAGIMVLIYIENNSIIYNNVINFRPLAGIMVLINYERINKVLESAFPSPCGDYGSYRARKTPMSFAVTDFRPLAGIMVLIRTLYRWLYEAVEMAFCGADHIFSSFFVFCKKMIFKKSFRLEF